jgi:hypothetical protein
MAISDLVAQIDAEIAQLQQARSLLATISVSVAFPTGRRGKNAAAPATSKPTKKRKKRNLSPDGRARIAEAAKRRWAKQKAKGKRNNKA